MSGHSLTHQETVAVTKVEIDGAIAFEVSGMFTIFITFLFSFIIGLNCHLGLF